MKYEKFINNYFLILFSLIPITILIGSAFSVINILLIDISFIILILYNKDFSFIKSKPIIVLFGLYIYLMLNSFISIDFETGFLRNFGFLRIIILFAAFNYFYFRNYFYKKLFKFWLVPILIVLIDVLIESYTGRNLLGFGEEYGKRIVSFFKDEPIVGGYLNGFFLIIIGFLLNEFKSKKKYVFIILLLSFLFVFEIILTGERSNSIKAFIALVFFLFLFKDVNIKVRLLLLIASLAIIFITIVSSPSLKYRYFKQTHKIIKENNNYFALYNSGFEVFKNHKMFGVGNKNYREETCQDENKLNEQQINKYVCSNHPHQIYFELLSEHGFIGSLLILLIFYVLIFSKFKETLKTKNYLKLGTFIYMVLVFLPLLPSGAFFNNYLITIFSINLSLFYASDKKMNIFYNDKF